MSDLKTLRPRAIAEIISVSVEESTDQAISVSEAKEYARIDGSVDDLIVDTLIEAGQEAFEAFTGKLLFERTVTVEYEIEYYENKLYLPWLPIVSITSVTDTDDEDEIYSLTTTTTTTTNDQNSENGYKQQIRHYLTRIPHWVAFSATIDKHDNLSYFEIQTRKLIDEGYLSPYNLVFPISKTEDYTDKVCLYLVRHKAHIIVYTSSHEEGQMVTARLNKYQPNCAEYVDCNTNTTRRRNIEQRFKDGKLKFLVNVRLYGMGFDAPITTGICLFHIPVNERDIIQRLGRMLRNHQLKKSAEFIIPCTLKNDEERIQFLLKAIADNDEKMKDMLKERKKGLIETVNLEEISIEDDEFEEKEDAENIDSDEMNDLCGDFEDIIVFDYYGNCIDPGELWYKRLEESKKFIDEKLRRPSSNKNKRNDKYENNSVTQ